MELAERKEELTGSRSPYRHRDSNKYVENSLINSCNDKICIILTSDLSGASGNFGEWHIVGDSKITTTKIVEAKPENNSYGEIFAGKLKNVLDDIACTFDLNRTNMAEITRQKSRATIYSWINEKAQPRDKTLKHLFDLWVLSKDWKDAGYKFKKSFLKLPILEGKSVWNLLCEEQINKEAVMFAGARLQLEYGEFKAIKDPFEE